MFNSKYSKVLTVILIIAIIAIIGLLIFLGIDYYQKYITTTGADDAIGQFDGYVNNVIQNNQTNNTQNNQTTNVVNPDIDVNNVITNTNTNTGGSSSNTPTYKGFKMIGKMEIPATKLNYPILADASPQAIQVSIAYLYGPGVNEIGNTVYIGHNFRNGTFFSNNKKLVVGDKIYITDLSGKKITYTIYKKYTTDTNDFDYAVRETNGKREISLSTCTDDSKQRIIIWAKED